MSLPVCKFYKSNRNCKFGKNCRYLHTLSQRPPPNPYSSDHHDEAVSNQSVLTPTLSENCCENLIETTNNEALLINSARFDNLPASNSVEESHSQKKYDDESINQVTVGKEPITIKKICHYFLRHGTCAFGRKCRFEHNVPDSRNTPSVKEVPPRFQKKSESLSRGEIVKVQDEVIQNNSPPSDVGDQDSDIFCDENSRSNNSRRQQSSGKICSYFKSGYCRRGRYCRYSHTLPVVTDEQEDKPQKLQSRAPGKQSDSVKLISDSRPRVFRPPGIQQIVKLSDLKLNGNQKYREFDINYLKKRFGDWRSGNETTEKEDENFSIDVLFQPSDPDWPFDVKSYWLQLTIPRDYPEEVMSVSVPITLQDLPESIRRYVEISITEWISEKQASLIKNEKVELMVRPFFKWLDRNFEDIMTEALKQLKRELTAKAAGMEFIPAHQLKTKYNSVSTPANGKNEESDRSLSDAADDDDDSSDECLQSDDNDEEEEGDSAHNENDKSPSLSLDAEKKGTEIKLHYLQLKQNASSLLFEKLHLILQCGRCKNHAELTIAKGQTMSLSCNKCSHEMLIKYRSSLVHQFSSVIGYLDVNNCQAFDLILQDCTLVISCMACSKMTKINGMVSGQMIDAWCQACNARMKFATESVKFNHLEPSAVKTDNTMIQVVQAKTKKPPKDPAIREGYPLPDFGACKHYKQSYRWLRFPCCGKAYPCDVCHDKKEDHEMMMANRMICGHCCKEQNYSSKNVCTACNEHLTKVHSAHWEGGTGCRDKITMSRNDQQKYKNMNKTLSNHKKKVQNGGPKKKTTKLRHA